MARLGGRAVRKCSLGVTVFLLMVISLWHFSDNESAITSEATTGPLFDEPGHGSAAAQDESIIAAGNKDEDLPHLPAYLRGKTLDLTAITPETVELDSDLHRLQSNDDFLPYLAGISSVPNLSVATAYGTCDFTDEELQAFIFHAQSPWVLKPVPDSEIQSLRQAWQHFVKHGLIPWEAVKDRFNGRGIVIVGGHGKEANRIKVVLRALKKHGSELAVEINYFDNEMDETTRQELIAIYGNEKLFFNDLADKDQPWNTYKVFIGNYQLKTAAMVNSRFAEILLLDADNIPISDPAALFESKAYREYGSVFWPDHPRTRREHPAWAAFNAPCRREEYEFETGQALVDKRRNFYHLQLAAWMNSEPYWREMLLGDKDLFRFAWHALKTRFGTPVKWLTSLGFVAEQESKDGSGPTMTYCGHTFGQAFPDHNMYDQGSGIGFLHVNSLKTAGAPLLARFRKLKGGVFTHFKRVGVENLEDWSHVEWGVGLTLWSAGYYYNFTAEIKPSELVDADEDLDLDGKPIGEAGVAALELTEEDMARNIVCMDHQSIEARPIAELGKDAAMFEQLFKDTGGYWTIEDGFRGW